MTKSLGQPFDRAADHEDAAAAGPPAKRAGNDRTARRTSDSTTKRH